MKKLWTQTVLAACYPAAYSYIRDICGTAGARDTRGREGPQFTTLVRASGLSSQKPIGISVDDFGNVHLEQRR